MHDVVPVPPRTLNPASSVQVAMHPIHPMLVPFPIVCFVGTLLTDLAYWKTAEMMWANFSAWLLFAGLVMGSSGGNRRLGRFPRQPADPCSPAGLVSHARQCRRAGSCAVQRLRPQPRCLDLGRPGRA